MSRFFPAALFALALGCTDSPRGDAPSIPVATPDTIAEQLLAGARRAIGETGRVRSLSATATVLGPARTFQTVVHSARDGRARLDLGGHLLAGIGTVKGWVYDEKADSVAWLDDTTRSVIRGHELHMLTLAPETRLGEPHGHGARSWAGEAALAVEFRDDLGAPMWLYLPARDTLPLGWELVNHTGQGVPEVLATFAQWERVDGVRLFRHAVFTQGRDRYVYQYTELRLNAVPDSVFEPPAVRDPSRQRGGK
jgi:hypothetical protein